MDNIENNENDINQAPLTEEEVYNVLEYAKIFSDYGGTYLTPDLISARMRDVTLNPMQATQDMLDIAMKNPKEHELELQKFSQSFELSSMIYKKMISYLANMLSFDITYTSTAQPEDYKTPKYKKDLQAVETFLDKFDYAKELKIAVREMLRNDAYFACFVDAGDKYVLQELPSEYCKITGRWAGGFLFSFNMYWFLIPGVDINAYPPFFKKKFKEIFIKGDANKYIPSLAPEDRAGSSWIYWVDVPVDVGVCFKLTPEQATRLPYFTPLFNDLILQPLMRNLQKSTNMAAAYKIISGEVPYLSNTKASVKDSIAISPEVLRKYLGMVKEAVTQAITVFSAPLNHVRGVEFSENNKLYDSFSRTLYALSGINTNLIFTSDVKPNAIETQLSLNVDEQMMTVLYEQFDTFMDYTINKRLKNFKFNFEFEGTSFFLSRKERFDTAMSLFDKGIVLPQKIAASIGMKPHHMRRMMEESEAFGFVKSLTPPDFMQQKEMNEITMKNQNSIAQSTAIKKNKEQSKSTPKGGRPQKDISEISEDGMKSRETGANISRGGKI
jgi:hypothetical protein